MSFKEIVNQDHIVNFLLSSFQSERLAGAYLFTGKEGIGRFKMAKEFAKLINCENSNGDCCDVCPQCKKIDSDKHIDVHCFSPVNNSITISQVRELEKYIYMSPYESKKKVFIIRGAQYLSDECSNALLKTLEEPTKDSVIILIVNDAAILLPTISSRCQKVIFNSVDESNIKEMLIHKHKIPLLQAHFISYLAEGSPGRALDYKDLRENLFQKRSHILNSIYFRKFSLFKMEEFSIKDSKEKKKGLILLLDILLSWFRDLLVINTGLETPLINLDKKEDLLKLNSTYTKEELLNNINSIAATRSLMNTNVNVKIAFSKMRADLWK